MKRINVLVEDKDYSKLVRVVSSISGVTVSDLLVDIMSLVIKRVRDGGSIDKEWRINTTKELGIKENTLNMYLSKLRSLNFIHGKGSNTIPSSVFTIPDLNLVLRFKTD